MAQDKRHLPFNLFCYWMVIISQWKSWQVNVSTFIEQFEVPRGISYFSNTFFPSLYDDSCTFQMRKDQEVKVLHGTCWLEPRNRTHQLQGVLETWPGLFSYPTSLATVAGTGLSTDPSWTHQSPLLKALCHIQSLGKRGSISLLADYQPFLLLSPPCCREQSRLQ